MVLYHITYFYNYLTRTNNLPIHRLVAGLGVGAISARGFTILYNLEGFLCGAFLFKPLLVAPLDPSLIILVVVLVGGTMPFGGNFGGFCSKWLLLIGDEEIGRGFGGLGKVGDAGKKRQNS